MAWIEGELSRTFRINAPFDHVLTFLRDPALFQEAFGQLQEAEQLEPHVWKWTLEPKAEKGIKFQAVYTVAYTLRDNGITWETRAGNMRSQGSIAIASLQQGAAAEVTYQETLAPDLPIPNLMAKVFGPIVAREVSRGIGDFLDRATSLLESRA